MADKRGKWTKEELKEIWDSYVEDDDYIEDVFKKFNLDANEFDLNQEAPCYWCGEIMLRAQYQGKQPDKWASWDVDHINSNPQDNRINNLIPMHPWCNKDKG
jgi:hypothetical protein